MPLSSLSGVVGSITNSSSTFSSTLTRAMEGTVLLVKVSCTSERGSSPTNALSSLGSIRVVALKALISAIISFFAFCSEVVRSRARERSIVKASCSIRVARSESSVAIAAEVYSFFFFKEATSALAEVTARRCELVCFTTSSSVFFAFFLSVLSALARERTIRRLLCSSYCANATSSRVGLGSLSG